MQIVQVRREKKKGKADNASSVNKTTGKLAHMPRTEENRRKKSEVYLDRPMEEGRLQCNRTQSQLEEARYQRQKKKKKTKQKKKSPEKKRIGVADHKKEL